MFIIERQVTIVKHHKMAIIITIVLIFTFIAVLLFIQTLNIGLTPINTKPTNNTNSSSLDFNGEATTLGKLNLFDYSNESDLTAYLNQPLTKLQCIKQITKLFGYNIVESSYNTCDYEDVDLLSKAVVGFAIRNKLVKPNNATEFGSQDQLSLRQLTSITLCYLGYPTGTDSDQPSQIEKIAREINLLSDSDIIRLDQKCLMKDYINIAYTTLFVKRSNKYTNLFEELSANNIITSEQIKKMSDVETDQIAEMMSSFKR